jgi:hypothetical protein
VLAEMISTLTGLGSCDRRDGTIRRVFAHIIRGHRIAESLHTLSSEYDRAKEPGEGGAR